MPAIRPIASIGIAAACRCGACWDSPFKASETWPGGRTSGHRMSHQFWRQLAAPIPSAVGSICGHNERIHVYPPRADQVETIGNGGEYGLQTQIDGTGTTRKVDDQRLAPDIGRLPRQYGSGHLLEADSPHQFAEPGQFLAGYRLHDLRRQIARTGPGATRGQYQV